MPTRRDAITRLAAFAAAAALPARLRARGATDPLDGTIAEYVRGFQRGDWSALEVTRRALERTHTNAHLNAIDALAPTAERDARAADARRHRGTLRGPLDGVPLFAKSIYDVREMPTTGSNAAWAHIYPQHLFHDAIEVGRLRRAGAVILGKTAADDFAYHGNGTSSLTGQVLNPHDPTEKRSPGGSSAGSAVAVATGMAFAGLGTDDGGSNRIPAQFTGVVGVKPTFGLVPRTGVIPTWPYLDTHGVMARTVADAAMVIAHTAGATPSDPLSHSPDWTPSPLFALGDDTLRGMRIGVAANHLPRAQMTAEALAAWDRAVADMQRAGAQIMPARLALNLSDWRDAFGSAARFRHDVTPDSRSPAATANALCRYWKRRTAFPLEAIRRGYEAYQFYYDVLPKKFEACRPLFHQPMEKDPAGRSFARSRSDNIEMFQSSFLQEAVHVMIYPTMPFNATPIDGKWPDVRTTLGYGNAIGFPEVSVPTGLGSDGMPALNVSFIGAHGDDARVLACAHGYELARSPA